MKIMVMLISKQILFLRFALWLVVMVFAPVFLAAAEPATPPSAVDVSSAAVDNVATNTAAPTVPETTPAATATSSAPASPSKNAVINLIRRLVQRGVLSSEDAEDLIRQAEEDAARAKEQEVVRHAVEEKKAVAKSPAEDVADSGEDTVIVTHVPDFMKDQMREEIKQDVMKQARDERWAAPRSLPEWVNRFRLVGDLRLRYEGDYFPSGNDNTGATLQFVNFNSINTGAPFDTRGTALLPQYNVDTNRQRVRLRARGGVEVDLGENFTAGMRVGTGESDSPVSENQSLGAANQGQGGDFSRYAIWLDRAFLKYEYDLEVQSSKSLALRAGRFDNPFFGTTMMWANDLGFDGVVANGKYQVNDEIKPFLTTGFFPVFNNDLNFATEQSSKFKSEDKWLAAIQGGAEWKVEKDFSVKFAAGFFDFQNIEGKLSNPFIPQTSADHGNTDNSRPSFAQTGNTYMFLRDITPDVSNGFGTTKQFQYFGLATPFRDVETVARLDYAGFDPFHIWFIGDYVRNIALDPNKVDPIAVNNLNPVTGQYEGGNTAWLTSFNMGKAALQKLWDWNVSIGYRYVESDSVVDGFCDADFGGGGTNLKGYTVGANLALASRVWCAVTWMSANGIAGPTFKSDILQLDLNAKF